MRTLASLAALLPLLLLAPRARALQSNAGGSTADFLRFGAGARALGMGEAFGPVAEGPEAIYWNPAGLAQLRRPEVSYTRSEFLDYFHHDFLAYAHPVPILKGTVGAALTRFSQASLPVVTNANIELGKFSPHSEAVALGYAWHWEIEEQDRLTREYFREEWKLPANARPLHQESEPWTGTIMAGAALKVVNETIHDRSATSFALDAGGLFRPVWLRSLSLSAVLRNLGSRPRFIRERESLPLEGSLGAAYDQRWWSSRLVPAFELSLPYHGSPQAKLGLEYRRSVAEETVVTVRGGYKTLPAVDLSPLAGLTFGLGTRWRALGADFGFQPMASLGQVYRLSLSWTF